jgi:predicted transcriptional regulator
MHKVIINSFKLRGLVLQLDALEILQELCQQQPNATEFIDKILNSIDSQKCECVVTISDWRTIH